MAKARVMTSEEVNVIENEFNQNDDWFFLEGYRDGKLLLKTMDNTEVLSFNVWSYLTKAEPPFDEVRIRRATEAEREAWESEEDYEYKDGIYKA